MLPTGDSIADNQTANQDRALNDLLRLPCLRGLLLSIIFGMPANKSCWALGKRLLAGWMAERFTESYSVLSLSYISSSFLFCLQKKEYSDTAFMWAKTDSAILHRPGFLCEFLLKLLLILGEVFNFLFHQLAPFTHLLVCSVQFF